MEEGSPKEVTIAKIISLGNKPIELPPSIVQKLIQETGETSALIILNTSRKNIRIIPTAGKKVIQIAINLSSDPPGEILENLDQIYKAEKLKSIYSVPWVCPDSPNGMLEYVDPNLLPSKFSFEDFKQKIERVQGVLDVEITPVPLSVPPSHLENQKIAKLLFMGLVPSGKTTITHFLAHNRRSNELNATIDYERHLLSLGKKKIVIFDTGGQTAFLDRFTGDLSEFIFSRVKAFVFVVDSIEIRTILRAKYYFDLAIKRLTQFSPEATVFIFQHKVDLIPKKMKKEVRKTIENYLGANIKKSIKYYETSVFTTSIVQALDAVMSCMLDGELYHYHEYLQNIDQKKEFVKEEEYPKQRKQYIPEEITYRDEFGKLKKRLVPKKERN